MKEIYAQGRRFVDREGREIILHGINMVSKDKERGYIGDWNDDDFNRMKMWGFNIIRLGIIWDGVEPQPGEFDLAYLEKMREIIRKAYEYGLYVFLDMHQDLYSSSHADGAPVWATITDGEKFEATPLWSDAYLYKGAVQKSFDHFWNNSPGPDGIGLQDHYRMAWEHVVDALGNEPNVIGYDLMNEPFIGSRMLAILEQVITIYVRLTAEQEGHIGWGVGESIEELDENAKMEAMQFFLDPNVFPSFVDSMTPIHREFESSELMQFYTALTHAIRAIDPDGMIFLETGYLSNMGVPSAIEPIETLEGKRDAQQVYAPHGYDLVTDTDLVHLADDRRVSFLFNSHAQTQERLDMPMLIGEWGAYYEAVQAGEASVFIQRLFEQMLCSDTYWCYEGPHIENYSYFQSICRGYPMAVAGGIVRYQYQTVDCLYAMEWEEDVRVDAPTVVYLPNIVDLPEASIQLMPVGSSYRIVRMENTNAGFLYIPGGIGGHRHLKIAH